MCKLPVMLPSDNTPDLLLSVIMPAHNARPYLAISVPAILRSLSANMELIVVDDGSVDGSAQYAEELGAAVVRLKRRMGAAGARNAGALAARGRILAFIDADVEVHPDTLSCLATALEEPAGLAAVFGSYDDNPADQHLVSVFKNLLHHHVHQMGNGKADTFWTGCGAVRRDVYLKVGPFHDAGLFVMEDVEFGHRLLDAGYTIELRPEIQCRHLKRWKLLNLISTDVFKRGIPWTMMMLSRRRVDTRLNMSSRNSISAAAGVAGTAALLLSGWWGIAGDSTLSIATALAGGLAVALSVLLQRDFYRLLVRKRGWYFSVKCVPLHLLYYTYSVFSLGAGAIVWVIVESPKLLKRHYNGFSG